MARRAFVTPDDVQAVAAEYVAMGFNRAYPATTMPQTAVDDLRHDLGIACGDVAPGAG